MLPAEPYTVSALREAVAGGWAPKYVFFWGHTGRAGAPVGKECLSQWYPAPFALEGTRYETAEHYMMCQKARIFGDHEAAARILAARHPGEAKELGRTVRGFDEGVWEQRRFEVVVAASHGKFSQSPALRAFLLDTQQRVLVEASPRDAIWGIGLGEKDDDARAPERWRGLNLLGFALMKARAMLQAG
jgi:hypothetical protein